MTIIDRDVADPLLEIAHLSVDYPAVSGTVHAVTDVSLSLARGEILGLAGESGSGKSTLAFAVTRLLRPPAQVTGGSVTFHSHNMTPGVPAALDVLTLGPKELRAFRWRQLAIVFQSAMNALNPVLTIGAQLEDVLRAHLAPMSPRARHERAADLLRLVGIAPERLSSYAHELSGGMRQRVGIALALALQPEVVILDEPTTALDVVVQREILTELTRLRDRLGFAMIFITHDLALLLEFANRVAIMYAGRLVELADARAMRAAPHHPYSYGLLNSFPTLFGDQHRQRGIMGNPPDLRNVPSGCAFHPRCPFAFAPCTSEEPALRPVAGEAGQRLVACHLYDPRYRPAPPTPGDYVASFAASEERR